MQSFGTHTTMIFVFKLTPHASYQTKISGVDTSYALLNKNTNNVHFSNLQLGCSVRKYCIS